MTALVVLATTFTMVMLPNISTAQAILPQAKDTAAAKAKKTPPPSESPAPEPVASTPAAEPTEPEPSAPAETTVPEPEPVVTEAPVEPVVPVVEAEEVIPDANAPPVEVNTDAEVAAEAPAVDEPIILPMAGLEFTYPFTGGSTVLDDAGADDEPGQKDLNWMWVKYSPSLEVGWGWDNTAWTGNNTGDACTLFDTDSDGMANYSACISVTKTGSYDSTWVYECTADARADRCSGPELAALFLSEGGARIVAGSDPFGATPPRAANDRSTTGCLLDDTVAKLLVNQNDVGGSAARLINVCSYPSGEPNSDPSDCVVAPNDGFLTIVKAATPSTTTPFVFNASRSAGTGLSSWTINGSGTVQLISYTPGTLNLSEAVPTGWSLSLDPPTCLRECGFRRFWISIGVVSGSWRGRAAGLPGFSTSGSSLSCLVRAVGQVAATAGGPSAAV